MSFFSESSTKTFETVADSPIVRVSSLQLDQIDEGSDHMPISLIIFSPFITKRDLNSKRLTYNDPLKRVVDSKKQYS